MHEPDLQPDDSSDEWPPRTSRLRAIRWRADAHLERDEYFAAAQALAEAFDLTAPGEGEVFRGLHHLAAAGYRHQTGETERAIRQLAHARRRLAPFADCARQVSAVEQLLSS